MLLQSPDDVARELRRNPGQEYELRPAQGPYLVQRVPEVAQ